MGDDVLVLAARCLRILAHPVRLRMVSLLISSRYTVGELADLCGLRPSAASEHLRLMENCGLLAKQREGRRIYYESSHPCLEEIIDCVRMHIDG